MLGQVTSRDRFLSASPDNKFHASWALLFLETGNRVVARGFRCSNRAVVLLDSIRSRLLCTQASDLPFPWMFLCFGAFILACGTTHALNIFTLWVPVYRLDGLVKLLTATLSIITAVLLYPLVPKALALPYPADLQREIGVRRQAEADVRKLNTDLEQLVAGRTKELTRSNEDMGSFARAASHDLQDPLRTVISHTQILERKYGQELPDDAKELIHITVDAAARMRAMIDELLEYSRMESARMQLEPVDCNGAVAAAIANLNDPSRKTRPLSNRANCDGDGNPLPVDKSVSESGRQRHQVQKRSAAAHRDIRAAIGDGVDLPGSGQRDWYRSGIRGEDFRRISKTTRERNSGNRAWLINLPANYYPARWYDLGRIGTRQRFLVLLHIAHIERLLRKAIREANGFVIHVTVMHVWRRLLYGPRRPS